MTLVQKDGKSISQTLIVILRATLPHVRDTGMTNDLAQIKTPPRAKGKYIHFMYQKRYFRLTEALNVQEAIFGYEATNRNSNDVTELLQRNIRNKAKQKRLYVK